MPVYIYIYIYIYPLKYLEPNTQLDVDSFSVLQESFLFCWNEYLCSFRMGIKQEHFCSAVQDNIFP